MTGSLITAELAESQGRPVYCVPGNIDSQCSLGTNLLISDGAVPLVVTDHLLRDLGLVPGGFVSKGRVPGEAGPSEPSSDPDEMPGLSSQEKRIVRLIQREGEVSVERLCEQLRMSPAMANGLISVLEIKGTVATALGKVFLAN